MYIYSSIICFLDSTREVLHGVGAQAGWTSLLEMGYLLSRSSQRVKRRKNGLKWSSYSSLIST